MLEIAQAAPLERAQTVEFGFFRGDLLQEAYPASFIAPDRRPGEAARRRSGGDERVAGVADQLRDVGGQPACALALHFASAIESQNDVRQRRDSFVGRQHKTAPHSAAHHGRDAKARGDRRFDNTEISAGADHFKPAPRFLQRRDRDLAQAGMFWRRDELQRVATDVGLNTQDLRSLAGKWPEASDLLQRRMSTLELDAAEIAHSQPSVSNDLKRLCSLCVSKKRCDHDLAAHAANLEWQEYCPNVGTLTALTAHHVIQANNGGGRKDASGKSNGN